MQPKQIPDYCQLMGGSMKKSYRYAISAIALSFSVCSQSYAQNMPDAVSQAEAVSAANSSPNSVGGLQERLHRFIRSRRQS